MQRSLLHVLVVWIALFAFWIALSGKLDAVHLVMGAVTAALVTRLSSDLLFTRTDSGRVYWLTFIPWGRFVAYLPWLAWEVVKANYQVLKLVLGPLSKLRPTVVSFKPPLSSEVSRAVLANSITLTPGTVTLDVGLDGVYHVHAIDEASARGVLDGAMARKVAATFRELPEKGGSA
jgi:multicomponent Na+:H+ antiporter subunit E